MRKGRKPKASTPNYARINKQMRKLYATVDECDRCERRAMFKFQGKDGKMHGACKKHNKKVN